MDIILFPVEPSESLHFMAALLTAKVMHTASVFIAKTTIGFQSGVRGLYAVADVYVHSETINDCNLTSLQVTTMCFLSCIREKVVEKLFTVIMSSHLG